MRIALFTETYLPHVNGIVTHVKSLKDGLERLGHEVLIVTADADARRHFVAAGILHCPARTSKRFYGYDMSRVFDRISSMYTTNSASGFPA